MDLQEYEPDKHKEDKEPRDKSSSDNQPEILQESKEEEKEILMENDEDFIQKLKKLRENKEAVEAIRLHLDILIQE